MARGTVTGHILWMLSSVAQIQVGIPECSHSICMMPSVTLNDRAWTMFPEGTCNQGVGTKEPSGNDSSYPLSWLVLWTLNKRLNLCSLGFLSVKEKLDKHCKVAAESYMWLHDEHTCAHNFEDMIVSAIIRVVLASGDCRTCHTGKELTAIRRQMDPRLLKADQSLLMAVSQKQQFPLQSLEIQQDEVLFRWQGPLRDTSGFYIENNWIMKTISRAFWQTASFSTVIHFTAGTDISVSLCVCILLDVLSNRKENDCSGFLRQEKQNASNLFMILFRSALVFVILFLCVFF